MKLSEMIGRVKDDEITLQPLMPALTNISHKRDGRSHVTFVTDMLQPAQLVKQMSAPVAVIVFIDRAAWEREERLEREREARDQAARGRRMNGPWRCFHCDELLETVDDATAHFGSSEMHTPACLIDIAEYREMEKRMQAYNSEDSELHREMHRMRADHVVALRREEEKGYARGLADGRAEIAAVMPSDATREQINAALYPNGGNGK